MESMSEEAKSGAEILALILELLPPGRFYTASEIFNFFKECGLWNAADFQLVNEEKSQETKGQRRTHNAVRDGKKRGLLEENSESKPYQYRVLP